MSLTPDTPPSPCSSKLPRLHYNSCLRMHQWLKQVIDTCCDFVTLFNGNGSFVIQRGRRTNWYSLWGCPGVPLQGKTLEIGSTMTLPGQRTGILSGTSVLLYCVGMAYFIREPLGMLPNRGSHVKLSIRTAGVGAVSFCGVHPWLYLILNSCTTPWPARPHAESSNYPLK